MKDGKKATFTTIARKLKMDEKNYKSFSSMLVHQEKWAKVL